MNSFSPKEVGKCRPLPEYIVILKNYPESYSLLNKGDWTLAVCDSHWKSASGPRREAHENKPMAVGLLCHLALELGEPA